MKRYQTTGHLALLLTVAIWGTTFISTKILLVDFQPVEILFFRFVIGLGASALCFVTWNFALKALGAVKRAFTSTWSRSLRW